MKKCPWCKSKKFTVHKVYYDGKIEYYCFSCRTYFIHLKQFGDNYPTLSNNSNWLKEKEEHKKFKNMGIIPKIKKDELINLMIDLWEYLKRGEHENNKNNF